MKCQMMFHLWKELRLLIRLNNYLIKKHNKIKLLNKLKTLIVLSINIWLL